MEKLFVIFVNYNSGNQLYEGMNSVLKSKSVSGVIVVDNASKDDSLKRVEQIKSKKTIIVIKNKKNLGFYKALNIAVQKAFQLNADKVMPLDFDLDSSFDFISKLAQVDADMVAPVLKFRQNGKWWYDYGGRFNLIKGSSYHIIKRTPQKKVGAIVSSSDKSNSYWFDFISGGCTIIKKDVFRKNGLFDEDYFVYWGDADFALHARENGFKVVMDGNTIVYHKIEINTQTKNFRKLKISFLDNITFIKKRVKWFFKPVAYLNLLLFASKILWKTVI